MGNTLQGATTTPAANVVQQTGLAVGNCRVYDGNVFRALDDGLVVTPGDYGTGTTHFISGNTFDNNVNGLVFSGTAYYYQGTPTVTLRCNTFTSNQTNAVGVRVKANTPFPNSLGSSGAPNGNRFDGIANTAKRFVYDDAGTNFQYYRYMSVSGQEELGTGSSSNPGGAIYNYNGNILTGTSPIPTISGTNACGGSTTGVNARPAGQSSPVQELSASRIDTDAQLGAAYPNPTRVCGQ